MALKVIGGIALLLLLIQPAKADGTTIDDFTLAGLDFTMPATIPDSNPGGSLVLDFEAYTPGPDMVIPWRMFLDNVFNPELDGFHGLYFCTDEFPITSPFFDFCDAEYNFVAPTLPYTVSGDHLTFIPGDYGALTITADTPEPDTLWLLGIGLLGVGLLGRHAHRQMKLARISSGLLESRASGGRFYRREQRT